jgi:predicted component of type VI protein secretion system
MKITLTVLTPGKWENRKIPITSSQFFIGRAPQCHLRPANPIISKRHCVIVVREGCGYIRDLNSTNGTFVNDKKTKGEHELADQDRVSIGPLQFCVHMAASVPVEAPAPSPAAPPVPAPRARAARHDEDSVAALFLSIPDNETPGLGDPPPESAAVSPGSTIFDVLAPTTESAEDLPAKEKKQSRHDVAKGAKADTSAAAKVILGKYIRRPRG